MTEESPRPEGKDEDQLRELLRAASDVPGSPDAFGAIYSVRGILRRRRLIRSGVGGCLVAGLVAALVLVPTGPPHRAPVPMTAPRPRTTVRLTGTLVSFNGCTDYLNYVKGRAESMVGPYGLQSAGFVSPGLRYDIAGGVAVGAPDARSANLEQGTSAAAPSQATPYSQTNDQVAGVDEPDTVKTDGQVVVTLTGPTLRVLDTSAHVLGSLQLSGDTGGGFLLVGTRVLVFSSPDTAVPGTTSVAESALYAPGAAPAGTSTAQVAVVDLSDPTHPQLIRTFRFDGSIVAARLVGQQVRLVLRSDGPQLSFASPSTEGDSSATTATNKGLIASSTFADWLPAWQAENPDGATTARQPLTPCDAVAHPDQSSGISTVTVLDLDPQSSVPGPGTSVVAAGETVYATAGEVYVAGPVATVSGQPAAGQQSGCCSVAPPAGASTKIYVFNTPESGPPTFAGAGTVPGWLVNSYAMDEDGSGRLRVASTSTSGGTSQSQISVLALSGGQLTTVGSVTGLGRGEFIRAVRFLGDQAYVVTFQTFDPLYIVDLSHPADPVLAGELDQPGFSEFLYPLPNHRLLGVGVQLVNNEPSGLVVATYDVSDPAHPRRIDESDLAQGFFGQGYDPHAFLYWPPVGLALLAVPTDQYVLPEAGQFESGGAASSVAAYQIGANGTLTRIATLGHDSASASRSVVIGDQVWVITSDGVVTSQITNLPATAWHPY
jgi:Beta propeller domain